MARPLTLIAFFAVGLGVYLLSNRGYLPPVVAQVLMVCWVLGIRTLVVPQAVDQAQETAAQERSAAAAAGGSDGQQAAAVGDKQPKKSTTTDKKQE